MTDAWPFQIAQPAVKQFGFIKNISPLVYPDESHVFSLQCKGPYFIKRCYVELFNIYLNRYEKMNFSPHREKFKMVCFRLVRYIWSSDTIIIA